MLGFLKMFFWLIKNGFGETGTQGKYRYPYVFSKDMLLLWLA